MIEVSRNSIVIRNVDFLSKEYKKFFRRFSLWDTVTHKYTFTVFDKNDADIYLPESVGANNVQKYFPKEKVVYNYANVPESKEIFFNMKHNPRDKLQEHALTFLKKIKNDYHNRERFLQLPTGTGKTFVTLTLLQYLQKRTIIVVDSTDLASQWKREILNHTDIPEEKIRLLSGLDSVNKELSTSDGYIYIAIHRTLSMLLSENKNAITDLNRILQIGVRIFDEAHVNFKNICMINSYSNVSYTVYLTATPNRSNFLDDTLYGRVFGRIPFYNGQDLRDPNYHIVILSSFNSNPSISAQASVKTAHGFNIPRWSNYLLTEGYSSFISSLFFIIDNLKLIERNKKTAIMLPTINMINQVKKSLEEKYDNIDIGLFIGQIKKEKRELELQKKIILTNDKIFDKAIDVKDLEILITYIPTSSLVKTEQIMGRLRNKKEKGQVSILVDITDTGFKNCVNQQRIRKKFYNKKAKKIIEIE